jgi:hypothetical protein
VSGTTGCQRNLEQHHQEQRERGGNLPWDPARRIGRPLAT